jgi:hypothetical protein
VGDEVEFDLIEDTVRGVIVEDRGALGVGGRRLYRIDAQFDEYNVMSFEMPADELRRVSSTSDK